MFNLEIKTRTSLLNFLIKLHDYKSYLEIGVEDGRNIKQICCDRIIGVDPDIFSFAKIHLSSDEFFAVQKSKFDIVFIDGLHYRYQVEKDIINSLNIINDGGTIVIHDCNPTTESMQRIPRSQDYWTGDVWKAFAKFRYEWNYNAYVVDIDCGCGIIECDKKRNKIRNCNFEFCWEEFAMNRSKFINLISLNDFLKNKYLKLL